MGMYTQLHLAVELKQDTPVCVVELLRQMTTGEYPGAGGWRPNHPFFEKTRWDMLFVCDSYYSPADTHSILRFDDVSHTYYLFVQSDLKNYEGEIEAFLDWIVKHVEAFPGDFLGYHRYEEDREPTLIYMPGDPEEDRPALIEATA